jgi:restriction system protein
LRDTARPLAGLAALRHDQVELLIGEIFRREGYTVELSAALNNDDGIDLMLRRDSETTLVQCKHWKAARVSSREIREFYGAMAAGGAPHGILVTTGALTPDAREFAAGKGIELMDGDAVASKIAAVARPGENLCAVSTWVDEFVAHARVFDPECQVCHGTMVIRHNRANGAPSWACRGYPRCPGRREPRLDLLPAATPH